MEPSSALTNNLPNPQPDSLAVIQIGEDQSGLRLTFLLIGSLQKFHHSFGDSFTVEFPTGSGKMIGLWEVAAELSRRLTRIFTRDADGQRAFTDQYQVEQLLWTQYLLVNEVFQLTKVDGRGVGNQTKLHVA